MTQGIVLSFSGYINWKVQAGILLGLLVLATISFLVLKHTQKKEISKARFANNNTGEYEIVGNEYDASLVSEMMDKSSDSSDSDNRCIKLNRTSSS